MPKTPKRTLHPGSVKPMHHVEEIGGKQEANVFQTTGGDFEVETREHAYSLGDDGIDISAENVVIVRKMRINRYRPRDVEDMNPVDAAGIRGGIHSENTYLVRMRDGSEWFYKQGVGEERDELFAYELAAMLFGGIVPEVRLADLGKGIGSIMRRVDGVQAHRVDGLHGYIHSNPAILDDLANMVVLDFLTGNTDRHEGNWFLTHDVRIKAIDNGFVGHDPCIDFRRCLRPAKASGVYHDPDLWPEFLLKLAETAQEAAGHGKEVRILADRVGLHAQEAIDLANLWEPKLQGLIKAVRKELAEVGGVSKGRVYIGEGDEPPKGVKVTEGPRGGKYYEPGKGADDADRALREFGEYGTAGTREVLAQALARNPGVAQRYQQQAAAWLERRGLVSGGKVRLYHVTEQPLATFEHGVAPFTSWTVDEDAIKGIVTALRLETPHVLVADVAVDDIVLAMSAAFPGGPYAAQAEVLTGPSISYARVRETARAAGKKAKYWEHQDAQRS